MSSLPLLYAPDPLLRRVSEPVESVTEEVRAFISELIATMYSEEGIGIAAPQVGDTRRIMVCDVAVEDGGLGHPAIFINPKLIEVSAETIEHKEGCLSVPGLLVGITRSAHIRVRYQDETGAVCEREAEGLFAACIQHEIDHLDGVLLFDHLGAVRRDMIVRRLKKRRKELLEKRRSEEDTTPAAETILATARLNRDSSGVQTIVQSSPETSSATSRLNRNSSGVQKVARPSSYKLGVGAKSSNRPPPSSHSTARPSRQFVPQRTRP